MYCSLFSPDCPRLQSISAYSNFPGRALLPPSMPATMCYYLEPARASQVEHHSHHRPQSNSFFSRLTTVLGQGSSTATTVLSPITCFARHRHGAHRATTRGGLFPQCITVTTIPRPASLSFTTYRRHHFPIEGHLHAVQALKLDLIRTYGDSSVTTAVCANQVKYKCPNGMKVALGWEAVTSIGGVKKTASGRWLGVPRVCAWQKDVRMWDLDVSIPDWGDQGVQGGRTLLPGPWPREKRNRTAGPR